MLFYWYFVDQNPAKDFFSSKNGIWRVGKWRSLPLADELQVIELVFYEIIRKNHALLFEKYFIEVSTLK